MDKKNNLAVSKKAVKPASNAVKGQKVSFFKKVSVFVEKFYI